MVVLANPGQVQSQLPPSWEVLRPHRQQSILWRTKQRRLVVAAGRGSGKTELALRRLALHTRLKNKILFYGGPTINQAKRVAWTRLLQLIPSQWIESINMSNLIIRTKFGSELHVCGMDKPHRIEGTQWDGGVLDEGSDIKPGTYGKSIFPALTHKNGWIWRIGVPKRTGIGAREFKRAFDEGDLDVTAFTWPSSTVLPAHVIREAQRELDEKTFNEQFNASWESAEGAIYYAFNEAHNVSPTVAYDPKRRICVGSDFNVSPMSWCLGHIIEHNNHTDVRIFDEIRIQDTNTPATLDYLWNKYGVNHHGGWSFYGDAACRARKTNAAITDYQLISQDDRFDKAYIDNPNEYTKKKRVLYPSKNPMLKDRFAASNAMICNAVGERRTFIHPRCKCLIDDLKSRSYAEGTMEPDDAADQGHMADAMDYIMYAEFPVGWDQLEENCAVAVRSTN